MLDASRTDKQHMTEPSSGRSARRRWAGALVLPLALGFSVLNTATASADTVIKTDLLRNWATGRCLDSNSGGDVYTLPCQSGNGYQTWSVVYLYHSDYDVVQIKNKATGRCLAQANSAIGTAPCAGYNDWGYELQLWSGVGTGWDKVSLRSVAWNTCLDSDSAGSAYSFACNGGGYQKWKSGF